MILLSILYTYVPEETRVIFEPNIRNMAWIIPFSNRFVLWSFKYDELICPDFLSSLSAV